jgi:hypothetical protein
VRSSKKADFMSNFQKKNITKSVKASKRYTVSKLLVAKCLNQEVSDMSGESFSSSKNLVFSKGCLPFEMHMF